MLSLMKSAPRKKELHERVADLEAVVLLLLNLQGVEVDELPATPARMILRPTSKVK